MSDSKQTHWLRILRNKSNLTQEELAARLQSEGWSTSRSAINSWENGKNEAPLSDPQFRRALSRVVRIPVRLLLKQAGYEVDTENHSAVAEQIASLVDQLPADKQEMVLRVVEQIAKV